jgi:protein angel
VATTHILYNPKRGDCKLAQLQYFLAHIDLIAFKCVKRVDNKLVQVYNPIIFCGDFNCDFRSKFYEFINNGKLTDYKNLNRNLLSGQLESTSSYIPIENNLLVMGEVLNISDQCQFKHEVTKRISVNQAEGCEVSLLNHGGNELRHSFDFESVYKHHNEEMSLEITTCLKDTKKTVDYIFFHNSENKNMSEHVEEIAQLKLLGRLELFKMNQIEHVTSLPIKNYPSDHFMIAARFSIT